jgi:hypothetical protein
MKVKNPQAVGSQVALRRNSGNPVIRVQTHRKKPDALKLNMSKICVQKEQAKVKAQVSTLLKPFQRQAAAEKSLDTSSQGRDNTWLDRNNTSLARETTSLAKENQSIIRNTMTLVRENK